ncbi:DUF6111 family protein [Bradyrhizobium sp. LHD-71]|uniref:DUF6111 family protein n=1 Tax=Bradyrhizobium sp. LHD-71 TaxID=3072141 RepID=UPI00280DC0EC|nr:DUF6111 family protein [Bradyrhizobium sp. LHD-71]MDQ8730714.1 DUF6111 family protein [Bradyrhizobium sp. LHD-71]
MIRPVLTEIGLFLIPFAVYALYLIATRAELFHKTSWPLPIIGWLTAAALLLIIASFAFLASFSGAPPGSTYVPAHIENGRLVRGAEK